MVRCCNKFAGSRSVNMTLVHRQATQPTSTIGTTDAEAENEIRRLNALLDSSWSKQTFSDLAQIMKSAADPKRYEAFLIGEVQARPTNLHAARLLIQLGGERRASPEDISRLDGLNTAGAAAAAILQARKASLHLGNGSRALAWNEACHALDGIDNRTIRHAIARALADRFDWHGHFREAEYLIMRGRTTSEMFDAMKDLLAVRQVAQFNETTRAMFAFSAAPNNPHRSAMARLHFDWRWRVDGPSVSLLSEAEEWESFVQGGDIHLRADRIAMAMELGLHDLAQNLLERMPEAGSLYRSVLPVAKLVAEAAKPGSEEAAYYASLFQSLVDGGAYLSNMVKREPSSVAVVGNSACEIGLGKGQHIDGHDLVIRFNRVAVGDLHRTDYGSKTDVHVLPIRADPRSFPPASGASVIAYVMPHARFRFRHWDSALAHMNAGRKVADFPGPGFSKLATRLRAPPSAGLRVLDYLSEQTRRPESVGAFGFSFTDQIGKTAQSSHYFEATRPSMHHNWLKEREIFDAMFRKK